MQEMDKNLFIEDKIREVYKEIMKTVPSDHLVLENVGIQFTVLVHSVIFFNIAVYQMCGFSGSLAGSCSRWDWPGECLEFCEPQKKAKGPRHQQGSYSSRRSSLETRTRDRVEIWVRRFSDKFSKHEMTQWKNFAHETAIVQSIKFHWSLPVGKGCRQNWWIKNCERKNRLRFLFSLAKLLGPKKAETTAKEGEVSCIHRQWWHVFAVHLELEISFDWQKLFSFQPESRQGQHVGDQLKSARKKNPKSETQSRLESWKNIVNSDDYMKFLSNEVSCSASWIRVSNPLAPKKISSTKGAMLSLGLTSTVLFKGNWLHEHGVSLLWLWGGR